MATSFTPSIHLVSVRPATSSSAYPRRRFNMKNLCRFAVDLSLVGVCFFLAEALGSTR